MDQTKLFIARVKTFKLQLKAQQRESGSLDSPLRLKPSRRLTPFAAEAKDVATCITKLQQFLLQHRRDYIDSVGHLGFSSSSMTDEERDQIDSEAQKIIKFCSERIRALESAVTETTVGEQVRLYRKSVYNSLGEYLKSACRLYSEQRAVRVKRILDRKRVSRLQPDGYKMQRTDSEPGSSPGRPDGDQEGRQCDTPCREEGEEGEGEVEGEGGGGGTEGRESEVSVSLPAASSLPSSLGSPVATGEGVPGNGGSAGDGLTEDERKTFQQENDQMFDHMTSVVDEVRQIEGKVLQISRLQEIFAEKVLDQAKQLDTISNLTVEASENVREGNEQVRGAIKNKASLRLWILFILIVCSFALLFLDWYS